MASQPDDIEPRAWQQALDWLFEMDRRGNDPSAAADLRSWLAADPEHARAYRQARQIWDMAPRIRPADAGAGPAVSGQAPRRGRLGRRQLVLGGALAAGFAAFVVAGGWIDFRADYATRVGETKEITLEDGTRLRLNTDSAIRVAYGDGRRKVELLRGEVHFAVTRDEARPFTVTADAARIDVLGTRFNVRMDPSALTIDVDEGLVAASLVDRHLVAGPALRRGERLRIDLGTGAIQQSHVAPEAMALWQRGRLVVDGATVAQVLAEIGRYHRGYIVLRDSALAARTVSGTFDLTQPLEAARAVVQPFGGRLTQVTPFLIIVAL